MGSGFNVAGLAFILVGCALFALCLAFLRSTTVQRRAYRAHVRKMRLFRLTPYSHERYLAQLRAAAAVVGAGTAFFIVLGFLILAGVVKVS